MVFPFDTGTGQELTNSSFTENGFYLDLANSHYLTIQVKREVWAKGTDGWVKDTRFNRVVSDGEQYTEEGIYTLTVTNPYTNATTEKVIYVGTNSILKAYVTTGMTLEEIEAQVAEGATIDEMGNIIPAATQVPESTEQTTETETEEDVPIINDEANDDNILPYVIIAAVVIAIIIIVIVIRNNKKKKEAESNEIVE